MTIGMCEYERVDVLNVNTGSRRSEALDTNQSQCAERRERQYVRTRSTLFLLSDR